MDLIELCLNVWLVGYLYLPYFNEVGVERSRQSSQEQDSTSKTVQRVLAIDYGMRILRGRVRAGHRGGAVDFTALLPARYCA